ncbi:MAG: hypothetical protein PVJ57_05630 [Phycisphaerae bacterium]
MNAIFGEYMGDGTTCDSVTCAPIGACCNAETGACVRDTTWMLCTYYWGYNWLGEGTSCSGENPCPQPPRGACCLQSGMCEPNLTHDECVDSWGGVYQGDDTLCEDVTCPQPEVGACCFPSGGCLVLADYLCAQYFGEFQGDGTSCWPSPCGESTEPGWVETFDDYEDGTLLYNVGGWTGWDDSAAAAGTVSSVQAHSAPHAIAVNDTADAIHPFQGVQGGKWILTAWQYIPSGLSGMTYFVVNSHYQHGGPYYWAVELHFDPATHQVTDSKRDADGTSPLPIVYDQWVEIRIEADLDTSLGTIHEYYNDQLLFTGDWITGGVGQLAIGNIDLYAPHSTVVYYDDISLVQDTGGQPYNPVRPLFVGVQYGGFPTRTTDLSGYPDVTWNNGFLFEMNGAAGRPDGTLYLSSGDFNTELYIAPIEGPAVYLADIQENVSGLAYGRGRLFGFCNSASPMGVYEIDPNTGATSLIAATGSRRFFGLDYNPADGLLYGYDEYGSPSGLCSIDIDTGVVTHIANRVPADNSAARGLACGYNKAYAVTVYGADYPMYVYDLAQGIGGTWEAMTHPFPDSNATSGAAFVPGYVAGDTNCDGVVNNFDIAPFVLALTSASHASPFDDYLAQYPDCFVYNADCNEDGAVNNFDISPFVNLVVNP